MIRRHATRDEIEALTADGWRFRKKLRKDKLYVSARKGSREKSLGRYSDEYWTRIEDVVKGSTKKSDSIKTTPTQAEAKTEDHFITTLQEVNRLIDRLKFSRCLHIEANGFCNYWHLNELPKQAKQLNKKEFDFIFNKVKNVEGVNEWAISPIPIICNDCPSFIDQGMINLIKIRLKT